MKKRTAAIIAGALFVLGVGAGVAAAGVARDIKAQLRPDFIIEIDGVAREFKNANGDTVYPVLYEGTTYLPVRAIGELMGKTVYWYENEKRVSLKNEVKSTVTDADVIVSDAGVQSSTGSSAANSSRPAEEKNEKVNQNQSSVDTSSFIGQERAREIALNRAGISADGVIFDRVELDRDNGVWHYEVEFRKGYTEYDAEIKADDGIILKWEKDIDD